MEDSGDGHDGSEESFRLKTLDIGAEYQDLASGSVEETTEKTPEIETAPSAKKDFCLLVIGGANDELETLREVSVITESGVCRDHSLPDLPQGRRGGVAGLVREGRTVVVCGGFSDDLQVRSECWSLSWNTSQWVPAPPLLHPTAYAAQVREKLLLCNYFV